MKATKWVTRLHRIDKKLLPPTIMGKGNVQSYLGQTELFELPRYSLGSIVSKKHRTKLICVRNNIQLSAVRRVGLQILTFWFRYLHYLCKKLKDCLSGAGYLDGSHFTKRDYRCLSLWNLAFGNTVFSG